MAHLYLTTHGEIKPAIVLGDLYVYCLIRLVSKRRKRRWGDENDKVQLEAPVLLPTPGILPSGPLTGVGKSNPELIQYAIRVFGSTDLTESQWKQCEDQIKVVKFHTCVHTV